MRILGAGDPSAPEPFAGGLDRLLRTVASNSPDLIVLRDDGGEVDAATLLKRVRHLSRHLSSGGLCRGERVVILAGAEAAAVVALIATLRAGLEPVMVPSGIAAVDLAAAVRAAAAVAMIGPSRYAGRDLGDGYLAAAAINDSIRGLLCHGPGPVDGAADISAAALDAEKESGDDGVGCEHADGLGESAAIVTLAGPTAAPRLVSHAQATLFADALSLVEQAGMLPSHSVVSLLAPSTLAGLVAGPFAAFAGTSRLVLHGPFDGRRFLRSCDGAAPFHLVAPAAAAAALAEACRGDALLSLVPVSRHGEDFVLPPALPPALRCVDLFAFDEDVVLAQARRDGIAAEPRRIADRSGPESLGARLQRARFEERAQALRLREPQLAEGAEPPRPAVARRVDAAR